jgi:hypothetical protein
MKYFNKKKKLAVAPLVTSETKQENGSRPVTAHSGISHHTVDMPHSEYGTISKRKNMCQQCCSKENLKEQALLIATITAVVVGVCVGIALRGLKCPSGKNDPEISKYSLSTLSFCYRRTY